MEMAATAIDTLSTAHRLERDFGMERNAAEGVAIAIHEHMTGNLVTKVDLGRAVDELRGEMKESEGRLRGEVGDMEGRLRGEIEAQGATLRGGMRDMEGRLRGEIEAQGATLRGGMRDMEGRLRGEIEAQGATLRGGMRDMEGRLRGEIEAQGATLRGGMRDMEDRMTVGLRSHTDTSVAALRADMHEQFKALYWHLWLMLGGFAALIVTLTKLLP